MRLITKAVKKNKNNAIGEPIVETPAVEVTPVVEDIAPVEVAAAVEPVGEDAPVVEEVPVESTPTISEPAVEKEYSYCAQCGSKMEPNQKFCYNCGTAKE